MRRLIDGLLDPEALGDARFDWDALVDGATVELSATGADPAPAAALEALFFDLPGDAPILDGTDPIAPTDATEEAPAIEPPAASAPPDPAKISPAQILLDRPDVLKGFYEAFYGPQHDSHSNAWAKRVGGDTPEAYAKYWYEAHGKYEGYSQGATTAQDNVSLSQILVDRPDVLQAFYRDFYGPNNDRNSDAWTNRVGGDTPEAYARYWYEKYGRWEGYSQTEKAAAENIDLERLLEERPDVWKSYYTSYYGKFNDLHSSAWVDRVGGTTVQDYAKYWYVTYGARQGYSQKPIEPTPAAEPSDAEPASPAPSVDEASQAPAVEATSESLAAAPESDPAESPSASAAEASAQTDHAIEPAPDDALSVGLPLFTGEVFI